MLIFYDTEEKAVELCKTVYAAALEYLGQPDIFELEVTTLSAEEMRDVNRESRGVDAVTDVLSFPTLDKPVLPVGKEQYPSDVNPDSGKLILGEIVLCHERIVEQAEEYGHTEIRETAYLFLHGLLHLLGFDHIEDADRAVMREKEEAILTALNVKR